MKTKFEMFATANDTDFWVLAVDDLMMLTDEQTAKAAYDSIEDIHDSPFGSAEIIPPHCGFEDCFGAKYAVMASQCQQANVLDYMAKRMERFSRPLRFDSLATPASERLRLTRELFDFFGDDINIKELSRVS